MATAGYAILADGLCKHYGTTKALDGFDLAVPHGAVCALLGPNGAGKSTAVRVLTSLLRPDVGRAMVGGFDVVRETAEARYRIGLTGQSIALDEVLTGRENLEMFGRLYHLGAREARRRAGELLEQFDLVGVAGAAAKTYSGGMRRRLDLAISFITAPPVLFLDEPTAAMDPRHRMEVWNQVRTLVAQGTTVLLTTHYLDEADQLADQISVIDRGRVIAQGTPGELKSAVGGGRLEIVVDRADACERAAEVLTAVTGIAPRIHIEANRLVVPVRDRTGTLTDALRGLQDAGVSVRDVALRGPTLDEVFARLTGHETATDEKEAGR
ncbi:ATP-binding cassette domain-containing protein [Nonomuraea sp. NPDC059023]|uniref:ATP-binding cassette domain-containing protein n=1 Tax=unclassified Nonomuraea TaxID=2593643 RepID=UPI0036C94E57